MRDTYYTPTKYEVEPCTYIVVIWDADATLVRAYNARDSIDLGEQIREDQHIPEDIYIQMLDNTQITIQKLPKDEKQYPITILLSQLLWLCLLS